MSNPDLYPLLFDPIFEYRPWGGRRLGELLGAPLPGDGPIGEAWVLSDRADHPSCVRNGALRGQSLHRILTERPDALLGRLSGRFGRFPLLLKFLDVAGALSVQVHPSERNPELIPAGETAKTEAWIVLGAGPASRIYAGLGPGTTEVELRAAMAAGTVTDQLRSFVPAVGDAVVITAGTLHALADDIQVFEVQQNSDVTFRLDDWNSIDPLTGSLRPLQREQALACLALDAVVEPVGAAPTIEQHHQVLHSPYFSVWRSTGDSPVAVGSTDTPRILVCAAGGGVVHSDGPSVPIARGDVCLLPADLGRCRFVPDPGTTLLEVAVGEPADQEQQPITVPAVAVTEPARAR
jgi:mannose-6-phosphate isomerase